jgi:glycosyltransferase involved in cell wall biosynthesis
MSGTPAVTFNNGPFPEIIDQGKTGYLCDNLNAMKKAIKNINKIDSQLCREQAIKQFSLDVMAKKYERQFKKTIKTKNA